MTPESQQIAIAEACGKEPMLDWQVLNEDETVSCLSATKHECEEWLADMKRKFPDSPYSSYHVGAWKRYPDYLNDLNAMHEAEKLLGDFGTPVWRQYQNHIAKGDVAVLCGVIAHATAAQRAEAFLRTLDLWKDE